MTVKKKNNSYYMHGKIKRADGSYYSYTKKIPVSNPKEAREYELEFIRKFQDIEISKTSINFKELCDEYLKQWGNVKDTSRESKTRVLNKACEVFGNTKINLITVDSLRQYIKKAEKKYSDKYADSIFYALRNVFDYAVYENYLQISPMTKVKRTTDVNKVTKEMLYWEPDQFNTFISYINDLEAKTIFTFLYYMGVRKGELRALLWKDIDLKNGIAKIYKTAPQTAKTQEDLTTPKTKNSNRNISMPQNVVDIMKEWKETQKQIYGFSEDCFVFGFYRPEPPENIRRWLKEGIKKASEDGHELPNIRLHDFRHSHASYLINNMSDKFTDFDIAKRLGDTVQTLHDTYAHWFKQADKKIIDFMNTDAKENTKADNSSEGDKYSELIELKKLLDMGIVTQEEFNQKKKQVLGI